MSDLALGLVTAGVVVAGGYFLYSAYDVNTNPAGSIPPAKAPTASPQTAPNNSDDSGIGEIVQDGLDYLGGLFAPKSAPKKIYNPADDPKNMEYNYVPTYPACSDGQLTTAEKPCISYAPREYSPPQDSQALQESLAASSVSPEMAAAIVENYNVATAIVADPTQPLPTGGVPTVQEIAAAQQVISDVGYGNNVAAATAQMPVPAAMQPTTFASDQTKSRIANYLSTAAGDWTEKSVNSIGVQVNPIPGIDPWIWSTYVQTTASAAFDTLNNTTANAADKQQAYYILQEMETGKWSDFVNIPTKNFGKPVTLVKPTPPPSFVPSDILSMQQQLIVNYMIRNPV